MWNTWHGLEDIEEQLGVLKEDFEAGALNANSFDEVGDSLLSLQNMVEEEKTANVIAGTSVTGWRTLKYFETDPIFKGEDAEVRTAKLRTSEHKAGAEAYKLSKQQKSHHGGYQGIKRPYYNNGGRSSDSNSGFKGNFI